jgi:hypothetical protein
MEVATTEFMVLRTDNMNSTTRAKADSAATTEVRAHDETAGLTRAKFILRSCPASAEAHAPNEPTYLRPRQLASRWHWHTESVRRALRQRRVESVIIGRSRLIPVAAVLKLEAEGFITRAE